MYNISDIKDDFENMEAFEISFFILFKEKKIPSNSKTNNTDNFSQSEKVRTRSSSWFLTSS